MTVLQSPPPLAPGDIPGAREASAGVHVHLSFSSLKSASRALREGVAALDHGYARQVLYLGCLDNSDDNWPEQPAGIVIKRLPPKPIAPGSSRLLRAASLPRWYANVFRDVRGRQDVSLIIAHNLASLPIAVLLKLFCRVPLLYDAHELETQREGWSRPIRFVAQLVEWVLIGFADHTLVVSDSIREWYKQRYMRLRVTTVRNTPSVPSPVSRSEKLRQDLNLKDDDLVCLFLGLFGRGRGIEQMVEAFSALPNNKHAVFVGAGPLQEELYLAAQSNANIHVLPAVPSSEVVKYASGADIGVVISAGKSLSYKYSLPNKLFEYAHAHLAIIVSDLPEFRRFVETEACGWVIPPSARALRDLVLTLTRDEISKLARPDSHPPSWEAEAERLLGVYEKLRK